MASFVHEPFMEVPPRKLRISDHDLSVPTEALPLFILITP
jgi:hypothetical protein